MNIPGFNAEETLYKSKVCYIMGETVPCATPPSVVLATYGNEIWIMEELYHDMFSRSGWSSGFYHTNPFCRARCIDRECKFLKDPGDIARCIAACETKCTA